MSCGIYKITNNFNNRSYIGQSVNIEERWKKHRNANDNLAIHLALSKYGYQNFTFEILEECSVDELNQKECYWIKQYNTLVPNGYNMVDGGSNGAGFAKGKKVWQYNLNGDFLRIFNSAAQASAETGVLHTDICKCCRGQSKYAGEYQWRYEDNLFDVGPVTLNRHLNKPVYQYDLDNNLIATYCSLKDAEEKTGIAKSTISRVCRGLGKTAGKFKWSYENVIE